MRHLLTHSGGLQWWAPLYKEVKGKKAYLERIVAMDLAYEPGARPCTATSASSCSATSWSG